MTVTLHHNDYVLDVMYYVNIIVTGRRAKLILLCFTAITITTI